MELVFDNNKINVDKGVIYTIQASNYKKIKNIFKSNNIVTISYDDFYIRENFSREIYYQNIDYDNKLVDDLLKIFNLNFEILSRDYNKLSFTERIFLNIIICILKSEKGLFFIDIYKYLDYNSEKKIKKLLLYLKEKKYYIFISSMDVNHLYRLGDYSVVCTKDFFMFGTSDEVFTSVSKLLKNGIDVPILPYITYRAKEDKNVKLFYSKDVRDIIKDIYKHV